ncbi:Isochorismatase hydrolase [Stipitochalara longipes BDJ]|nr:Isochorismatase hydrolase [Stipitochalara longipes BDJ]
MSALNSNIANTAIVLIDPYNDFVHPSGMMHSTIATDLAASNVIHNIKTLLTYARSQKIPVFYSLHQNYVQGHYEGWQHLTKLNAAIKELHVFAEGFGGTIFEDFKPIIENGDVVASKHWNMNGFENTDMNYQLRQRDITHLVLAGFESHTCFESTTRGTSELGYHVTLLTDATAAFDVAAKEISITSIWPRFSAEVTTTEAWIESRKVL